ncbi:MAG: LysR family transcriptional regulator [Capsulimonadaceae bacterium]
MELRHLRYFVVVAEELHFGRAAERLSISQPPLSQQIQQLERELKVSLFHRTSRQVELTEAGRVLFDEARGILTAVDQATFDAQRAARGELGRIGIGFVASATYDVLPDILRRFRTEYPEIILELFEMHAAQQGLALRERRIDVALARPLLTDDDLDIEVVVTEDLVAAVAESHPLAASSSVSLGDLAAEPFVLYPREPKPSYADFVFRICESAGFTPRVTQETQQMQTALSLVSAGLGVTVVPASVQNLRRIGVAYRTFDAPAPTTQLCAASRRGDRSPLLANFLRIVRADSRSDKSAATIPVNP